MKRRFALCLAVVLCAWACSPTGQTKTAAPGPGGPKPEEASQPAPSAQTQVAQPAQLRIGVMPKLIGIDYFNASERGAKEAGGELGVNVHYDGPVTNDVQSQVQMLETWIARNYDAICIAPNDPDAIAPVLLKARKRGIKVISWDADAREDARDFFCNQCTYAGIAKALMDVMAEGAGAQAKYIILTGSLTAANQNIWMGEMEKYRKATYPNMTSLSQTPKVSEESQEMATQVVTSCLKAYGDLQGIFAITSQALPGAAEAIRKAGAGDRVFLTGLSTPNMMREYVKDGTLKRFVLWNPVDLGYLTVHVALACIKGDLQPGATAFNAGRLGEVKVDKDEVILGPPTIFDKDNIDGFDF